MTKKNPKIVVLFMGKPGAGKGTQADILRDKLGLVHFNTGEVIRHRLSDPKTDQDHREKEIYNSGTLNTPSWVAALVTEKAHEYATNNQGIVFSGSPRTLYEANKLIPQLLNDYGKDKVFAVVLDIDDRVAVLRNSGRLTCDSCGFTMNPGASDLEKMRGGPCPKCGGKLIQRAIDTSEAILKKRLPEYHNRTVPTIDYMRGLGIVRDVDGRGKIQEVAEEIEKILNSIVSK